MSQDSLIDAYRRLFLRNGAAIVLSGAACSPIANPLPNQLQGDSPSQTNLNGTAPTRFQNVGGTRLAYRRSARRVRRRWSAFSISPAR